MSSFGESNTQSQLRNNIQMSPLPQPYQIQTDYRSERRKMTNQMRVGTLQNLTTEQSSKDKNFSNPQLQHQNSIEEIELYGQKQSQQNQQQEINGGVNQIVQVRRNNNQPSFLDIQQARGGRKRTRLQTYKQPENIPPFSVNQNQQPISTTPQIKPKIYTDSFNDIDQVSQPEPEDSNLMTGIPSERRRKRLRTGQKFLTRISEQNQGDSKFGGQAEQQDRIKGGSMQNFEGIDSPGKKTSKFSSFGKKKKIYIPSIQNIGELDEELESEEV